MFSYLGYGLARSQAACHARRACLCPLAARAPVQALGNEARRLHDGSLGCTLSHAVHRVAEDAAEAAVMWAAGFVAKGCTGARAVRGHKAGTAGVAGSLATS